MEAKSIRRNTVLLTGAQITQKILSFGYFWYLSNQLSKDTIGAYLFALSFVTLFGSITDIGLTPVLIRETSRDPIFGNRYLRSIISLKLMLGTLAVLGAAVTIILSGKPSSLRHLVYAATGFVFLDAFTNSFWGIFKAARNLWYESIATIAVQLVIISGGVIVLQTTRSPLHLVLTLVAASAVNFFVGAYQLRRVLGYTLVPTIDRPTLVTLLRLLPAFALSLMFVKIYNVVDTVLLGYMAGTSSVANYAIPAKVVTSLQQVIPATFAAVIFPVFSQKHRAGAAQLGNLFGRACAYLIGISFPATVALVALAPKILLRVWPAYLESAPALRVMALALPFIFLSFPTGYLLNACDRQRRTTINRGVVVVVAILGNLALIPSLGYFGSAIVFLASNILLLTLDGFGVRPLVTLDARYLALTVGKILASCLIMLGTLMVLWERLGLFSLIAFGAGAYLVMAACLRIWAKPMPSRSLPPDPLYA